MAGGTAGRDRRIPAEGRERVRGFALSQKESKRPHRPQQQGIEDRGVREQGAGDQKQRSSPLHQEGRDRGVVLWAMEPQAGARPEAARCGREEESKTKTSENDPCLQLVRVEEQEELGDDEKCERSEKETGERCSPIPNQR